MNLEAQSPETVMPRELISRDATAFSLKLNMNGPRARQVDLDVALATIHALHLGLVALGFTKTDAFQPGLKGHLVLAKAYHDGSLNVRFEPASIWIAPERAIKEGRWWLWFRPSTGGVGHG